MGTKIKNPLPEPVKRPHVELEFDLPEPEDFFGEPKFFRREGNGTQDQDEFDIEIADNDDFDYE